MDKDLKADYNMSYTVVNYATDSTNAAQYKGYVPFENGISRIQAVLPIWDGLIIKSEDDSTGITQDKDKAKYEMADYTGKICSTATAFAIEMNSDTMKAAWAYPDYVLYRASDAIAVADCTKIIDFTEANKSELAPYGIDDKIIAIARARITVFKGYLGKGTAIISNANAALAAITELVNEQIDPTFQKLDALIDGLYFEKKQQFVDGFKKARKLHHLPTNHTELEVTVIDKATKLPIEGAKVTIAALALSALTTHLGIADIKKFKGGKELHILISALGYKDFSIVKDIIRGHKLPLIIELEKI